MSDIGNGRADVVIVGGGAAGAVPLAAVGLLTGDCGTACQGARRLLGSQRQGGDACATGSRKPCTRASLGLEFRWLRQPEP